MSVSDFGNRVDQIRLDADFIRAMDACVGDLHDNTDVFCKETFDKTCTLESIRLWKRQNMGLQDLIECDNRLLALTGFPLITYLDVASANLSLEHYIYV